MHVRTVTVLLSFTMLAACGSNPAVPDSTASTSSWVAALIRQLEGEPVANPPAYIARYDYKNQDVYFVPQRCCDVMSVVYKPDGTALCHPDGGLTGKGDGLCADFFAERRNERIIWRDTRH
jgi:uncharacterized protein DUF6970